MSLSVFEADYMVPWIYDFRNAPDQQQVLIAAKGVTEKTALALGILVTGRVGFGTTMSPLIAK